MICAAIAAAPAVAARAAEARAPLGPKEQAALLVLLDAVDTAQRDGVDADARVQWDAHVLKSSGHRGYVPFTISLDGFPEAFQSGAVYVRAVAIGAPLEQRSELRTWVRTGQSPLHMGESVSLGVGELPVGGPGVMSSRRSTQQAAESSAILELQRRAAEKERADAEKRAVRDPALFPLEEYYLFDGKSFRDRTHRVFARAVALPPGDYDLFIAVGDRGAKKPRPPVILERRITVPDFWNDDLRLSTLILSSQMQLLKAPLVAREQSEQPYTFGLAALTPTLSATFTPNDALTIVYQICNYAAPDATLTANYHFYRLDPDGGARRLFNGTQPQILGDDDLPPPGAWETQAFAMQVVPLASFPPGRYELEVSVSDRVLRATAKGVARFRVE